MKTLALTAAVCLLFFGGCAPFRSHPELSENSAEAPEWIYAPYELCVESEELCASGEAKTLTQADQAARINLGSIFEVTVKSDLNVFSSTSQNYPWQGAVRQEVQQSLQESVNQVLEAVQIKKRAKHKGLTYAIAALNRSKASELISGRLNKVDAELATLWGRRSRTNLRNIVRLFLEREKLNERYSIVAGAPKPSPIPYKEIIQWKDSRSKSVPLNLRIGRAPDWLADKLRELLTESGFRLVAGEADKALTLNVESIKEFLNVQGFEKYTFTMNLESTEKGEKNKLISVSETVTGRTQEDALLKVKQFFSSYIEQHLSDLHLD